MGAPRLSTRPLRGHAALRSPRSPKRAQQERPLHLLTAAPSGKRSRPWRGAWTRSGAHVLSGAEGIRAGRRPPQRPPCESSIHRWSSARVASATSSL
eukprot:7234436-Pyramimonas_sp.AAC.1